MKLPSAFTTVTPLSKTLAFILFVTLPVIGFFAGVQYNTLIMEQKTYISPTQSPVVPTDSPEISVLPTLDPAQTVCTSEAKLCPDGSYVSRGGPNCEFAPCSRGVPPPGSICPSGYTDYGVPLGCVTKQYYNDCMSGKIECPR